MRTRILSDKNQKRLVIVSRQLLYHLIHQDIDAYIETITKEYLRYKKQVPHLFIKTFNDHTLFMAAGYSYLAGFACEIPLPGEKSIR